MSNRYFKLSSSISKYTDILKKTLVTSIVILIFPEIKVLKQVLVNIMMFISERNLLFGIEIERIRRWYSTIRYFSLVIIFICTALICLYVIVRPLLEKKSIVEELSPFEISLRNYLDNQNNKYSKKSYLITGEWGSGKTHLVTEFFKRNFLFSKRPVYKISCFGLDTRQQVLKEIETQIEIKDNSIVNWIQFIPLIGAPIFGLLKHTYNLQSISSDAIFIFDDFERVTSSGISADFPEGYYHRNEVARTNFGTRSSEFREFNEINKEFKTIQESISSIQRNRQNELLNSNLQKYNVVTGLINELIENSEASVIIICNTDVIGNNYMDKIFRGKLDCITYRKSPDKNALKNIYHSCLENQVFQKTKTKNVLYSITDTIIDDFQKVWLSQKKSNLRDAKSEIQALFDTISEIEDFFKLTEINVLSLLYSIHLISFSRNERDLSNYDIFPVGGSLKFYLLLYNKEQEYQILEKSSYFDDLKWFGMSLSGFWILNFSKPDNITNLMFLFTEYPYHEEEKQLMENDNEDFLEKIDISKFSRNHLLYLIGKEMQLDLKYWSEGKDQEISINYKLKEIFKNNMPEDMESQYFFTRKFLEDMGEITKLSRHTDYEKKWFDVIYELTGIDFFVETGNNVTLINYNNLVKKSKN